jgi:hypothetical protein
MARKSRRLGQGSGSGERYACPHCDDTFANETAEDVRRLRFHRIMHVDDSGERWKLMGDWIAEKEREDALVARADTRRR